MTGNNWECLSEPTKDNHVTRIFLIGLLGVGYQKYGSNTAMSLDAMHHLFDVS